LGAVSGFVIGILVMFAQQIIGDVPRAAVDSNGDTWAHAPFWAMAVGASAGAVIGSVIGVFGKYLDAAESFFLFIAAAIFIGATLGSVIGVIIGDVPRVNDPFWPPIPIFGFVLGCCVGAVIGAIRVLTSTASSASSPSSPSSGT